MNGIALAFLLVSAISLLALPRRWAALPLLAGACYMPLEQGIAIGPFTFTVLRLLVAVGILRVISRGERLVGGLNAVDWLIAAGGLWACLSSMFHENPSAALVNRLGFAYNTSGVYFLIRVFCTSAEDVVRLCRATAVVLTPVALEMIYEQLTFHNLFSIVGSSETPAIREGRIRAFGPFAHPILAGSVGAATLPLMVGIWRSHRSSALLGTLVCATMVLASASSGPAMSAIVAVAALCFWHVRRHMRLIRWLAVAAYGLLFLVMKAPPYYLIARIDLAGGSTGWHRARLLESALDHIDEWWFAGTDYTRHWMGEGVEWSPNHVDITNYYLTLGVMAGLPLTLLIIAAFAMAFSRIGRGIQDPDNDLAQRPFMLWSFGCALTAHATTCLSVSYFDQSFLFLYLTLAAIASATSGQRLPSGQNVKREPRAMANQAFTLSRANRPPQPPTV